MTTNDLKIEAKKILLVDDEEDFCAVLAQRLEMKGYNVFSALNLADATELLKNERFDLVISDFNLPDGSAADIAHNLVDSSVPLIVMSGEEVERDRLPQNINYCGALEKPISSADLFAKISETLTEN